MSGDEVQFYNWEQKERYFKEREKTYRKIRVICRVFFNISRPFEEKLAKDCSNFTSTEILNMYASCLTHSWEQLLNFNSQLKIYTAWCIKESLVADNQNHYEEIDKNDMYRCLNLGLKESMYISRRDLEKIINSNQILNPSDEFLVLAINEGLGGLEYKDLRNLMPDQFKEGKVFLEDRELTVSQLLTDKAIESADTYDKVMQDKIIKNGYSVNDPSVIKDSCNVTDMESHRRHIQKIQRRLKRLEKEHGKVFSYVGLRDSGRIDLIKNFMAADNSKNIRETYDNHREEIEYRYGKLGRIARWIEEHEQFFE